ncbi:thioredoxin family protein [Patescibacteria group bacterium AH-259-L07]|nr:thioredoxin family protein [Patescibacteria group bacterium AH-259-L07]
MAKTYKTLKQLLADDPLDTLYRKIDEIYKRYSKRSEKYKDTAQALANGSQDKETAKKLKDLDWKNDKDLEKAASILGVKLEALKSLIRIRIEATDELEELKNITSLKKSWKMLLKNSPITEIDGMTFPFDSDRPFIVFYSANWCMPCHMTKPTFARLSRFFTKAKLFYSSDRALRKEQGIEFIPQLVAYLPNGARVSSDCGGTTKELWNNMNLLISMGQNFKGNGTLVCTDTECKIEPKK